MRAPALLLLSALAFGEDDDDLPPPPQVASTSIPGHPKEEKQDPPVVEKLPPVKRAVVQQQLDAIQTLRGSADKRASNQAIQEKVGLSETPEPEPHRPDQRIGFQLSVDLSRLIYAEQKSVAATKFRGGTAAALALEAFDLTGGSSRGTGPSEQEPAVIGTRVFNIIPHSMDDSRPAVLRVHNTLRIQAPPVPSDSKTKEPTYLDRLWVKGVKISIDEDQLAQLVREQGWETTAGELESLEDALTREDAWSRFEAYAAAKRTAFLDKARKYRALENGRLVSLKNLLEQYRANAPEARTVGGLTRIHGFLRQSDELYLVGRVEPDRPPIQTDTLVVGLRTVWKEGLTPGCSLDPEATNLSGPQYSRVIGVPDDSRFALIMLEADYLMKKIMDGVKGEQLDIPGYQTLVDTAFGYPGRAFHSRFWLTPVQPAAQEIQVASDGSAALFDVRMQVLSEQMAATDRGLVGTGSIVPACEDAARSFTQHMDAIAARRPIYHELRGLFDIVLFAKLQRLMAPDDPLLESLAGLSYERVAIPKSYAGVTVAHSRGQGTVTLSGGCELRFRTSGATFLMATTHAMVALRQAASEGKTPPPLLLLEPPPVGPEEQHYALGVQLLAQEKFAEACARFTSAIEADATFAEAFAQRAVALFHMGRKDEALVDAWRAAASDPSEVSLRSTYFMLRLEAGLPDALKGLDAPTRADLANQYLGRAASLTTQGQYDAALESCARVIEVDPHNANAHAFRASIEFERRDLGSAESDAGKAVQVDPKNSSALNLRAAIRFFKEDYAGAVADMDRVLALQESPEALANRGLYRFFAGNAEEAAADTERAILLAPHSPEAATTAQVLYTALRMGPDKAREFLRPLLKLPNDILIAQAEIYTDIGNGKVAEAVAGIERTLRLLDEKAGDPAVKNAPMFREQSQLMLAYLLPLTGQKDRALGVCDEIQKRHPDWVSPGLARGLALNTYGAKDEAIKAFDACLKIEASNDPLLAGIFGLKGDDFKRFIHVLRLSVFMPNYLKKINDILDTLDRLAELMKESPSLPACLGLKEMWVAIRDHHGDVPPSVSKSIHDRIQQLSASVDTPVPIADAVLKAMVYMGAIADDASGNIAKAEGVARDFFRMRLADDFSPFAKLIPTTRIQAVKTLFEMYKTKIARHPKLDGLWNMDDPDAARAELRRIVAEWDQHVEKIGEPALTFAFRDTVAASERGVVRSSLRNRIEKLKKESVDTADLESRLDQVDPAWAADLRNRIETAYKSVTTMAQLATLDSVLKWRGEQMKEESSLYQSPADASTRPRLNLTTAFRKESPAVSMSASAPTAAAEPPPRSGGTATLVVVVLALLALGGGAVLVWRLRKL